MEIRKKYDNQSKFSIWIVGIPERDDQRNNGEKTVSETSLVYFLGLKGVSYWIERAHLVYAQLDEIGLYHGNIIVRFLKSGDN